MKTLVVYSSLTGNTKKVAQAVSSVLPECDMFPVEEAPSSVEGYDLVALGYWVDKGMPDGRSRAWLEGIRNARLAFFGTLGAWPDSDHAKECMKKGEELALVPERGNEVYGSWLCQGKIDPANIKWMRQMVVGGPRISAGDARWGQAAEHPGPDDLIRAREVFREISLRLQ